MSSVSIEVFNKAKAHFSHIEVEEEFTKLNGKIQGTIYSCMFQSLKTGTEYKATIEVQVHGESVFVYVVNGLNIDLIKSITKQQTAKLLTTLSKATAEQVEDVAIYTSTTYIQNGESLACCTTTLPTEDFQELTTEEITEAVNNLIKTTDIIKVEITQWMADSSNTITFTLPGADSDQIRMTQPTIPEPPKPAHYGEQFKEPSGTGPVITVGHPHPHTGMIVQWPSDVPEDYQEACFINLLNSCPMQDIQPLMKQLDALTEGDRIAFTWNNRDYKADFNVVKHRWTGGFINVRNATHTYGKVIKYQNNIRIQTISNFRTIKQF